MNQENDEKKVDPKAFLGAKVISPLEQEKLVGGTTPEEDTKKKEKVKKKEKAVE